MVALVGILGCRELPEGPESETSLRIGLMAVPHSLDPHLQDDWISWTVLYHLYETLVSLEANMTVTPQLAERWETLDDLTWRFHLRSDAKFHDGSPVTADDVVSSIRRALNHPESEISGLVYEVFSVSRVSHTEVEITTGRPYPILLNKLSFVAIVPAGSPARIEKPIGSGPYRVQVMAKDHLRLRRFDGHWGPSPPISEVVFRYFDDATDRRDAYRQGQVNFLYPVLREDLANLPASDQYRLIREPGLYVGYLQFRVDRPPFDDDRVRRAVHLAIDRARLVEEAAGGAAQPANQFLSPQVFGYVPDLPALETDREEAKRLLAEAGFPEGLDWDLYVLRERTGAALAAQLQEVGIRLNPILLPRPQLFEKLASGEVDLLQSSWGCPGGDASEFFDKVAHSQSLTDSYGTANSSGYSNPLLDALVEDAGFTFNVEERRGIFEHAMSVMLEDLPLTPLIIEDHFYMATPELQWTPRMDGLVLAQEASFR